MIPDDEEDLRPAELLSLEAAIAQGDLVRVRTLLDEDPAALDEGFVENCGFSPLMWACRRRAAAIAEELLQRGARVNARNRSEANGEGNNFAFWFAANGSASGGAAIARQLIAFGANVSMAGEFGQTALHQAALWNHAETALFLLQAGADVNAGTTNGETPLLLANRYGFAEVAQMLRHHGAEEASRV